MLDSSQHQPFLYLPRTEISVWEIFVCDWIAPLGPPLGRQAPGSPIYVGGSSESLPSVGSDILEIRPVSSCLFYGRTLCLIPNIKRLGFLKYQQLSAPLAGANHLAHRCGKAWIGFQHERNVELPKMYNLHRGIVFYLQSVGKWWGFFVLWSRVCTDKLGERNAVKVAVSSMEWIQ